ncbi:fimbrial protein [Yersinia bercovieri]|uniref:fimbrial protein n=1 Tax=Yersinia bercovieri TaxID=634 RepID=UPI0011AB36DD|nr:fimbrial protein [Yersinia bercovieri]
MNINMKKKLIVTSLLAASVFASTANATVINITGSIAASPCKVKSTSTSSVKMPAIFEADISPLKTGDVITKSVTPININLEDCPIAAGNSNAVVTFTGTAADDAFSLGSVVKGVALKVYDKTDNEVKATSGTAKSMNNLITASATQTLEYKLKYVKTADTFKEGAVDTALTFDVAYN